MDDGFGSLPRIKGSRYPSEVIMRLSVPCRGLWGSRYPSEVIRRLSVPCRGLWGSRYPLKINLMLKHDAGEVVTILIHNCI